jgi:aspartate 1-decarboxylase
MTVEILYGQVRHATITDHGGLFGNSLTIPQYILDDIGAPSHCTVYVHNLRTGITVKTVVVGGKDERVIATGRFAHDFLKEDGIRINFFCMMDIESAKEHKPIIFDC